MTALAQPKLKWRTRGVLPGFSLTMGYTILYLGILVLVPLAALVWKTTSLGPTQFFGIVTSTRAVAAYKLTFGASAVAAVLNAGMGILLAWVLVRYQFFGKSVVDALIDLPFALPTAVAGIALTAIYAPNGWLGQYLEPLGIKVAYTPNGILVALIFIGLPFIVRTLQPVMEDLDLEIEEAAATLGARRWQIIRRVIMPTLLPALMTGFALALARAVGEYGSVIFIAGNMPYVSEIAPLLIVMKLQEYNYAAATVIATVMLIISFVLLLAINLLQAWSRKRFGHV